MNNIQSARQQVAYSEDLLLVAEKLVETRKQQLAKARSELDALTPPFAVGDTVTDITITDPEPRLETVTAIGRLGDVWYLITAEWPEAAYPASEYRKVEA